MAGISLVADGPRARATPKTLSVRLSRTGYRQFRTISSQMSFYFFWEKRWFFIALLVGGFILSLPQPEGLSREAMLIIAMYICLSLVEPIMVLVCFQ